MEKQKLERSHYLQRWLETTEKKLQFHVFHFQQFSFDGDIKVI